MKPYTLYADLQGNQYKLFPNFGVCQVRRSKGQPWKDIPAGEGIKKFDDHKLYEVEQ